MAKQTRKLPFTISGGGHIVIEFESLTGTDDPGPPPPDDPGDIPPGDVLPDLVSLAEGGLSAIVNAHKGSVVSAIKTGATSTLEATTQAGLTVLDGGGGGGTAPTLDGTGAGWGGATAEPPAQGSSTAVGYTRYPISNWIVVPHQTVDGLIPIGLMAVHVNGAGYDLRGIDHVDMAVSGGAWSSIAEPTANPICPLPLYWAFLDAATLADGLHEIRARVYPTHGKVRVHQGAIIGNDVHDTYNFSLWLYANSGGSLTSYEYWVDTVGGSDSNDGLSIGNPLKTIAKAYDLTIAARGNPCMGGVSINLLDGNYAWGVDTDRATAARNASSLDTQYLTIQAAAGHDAVKFDTPSTSEGWGHWFIKTKRITHRRKLPNNTNYVNRFWWCDDSDFNSWRIHLDEGFFWTRDRFGDSTKGGGVWHTNTRGIDVNAGQAYHAVLSLNSDTDGTRADLWQWPRTLVNCRAGRGGALKLGGEHPDVLQAWPITTEDMLVYGLIDKAGARNRCQLNFMGGGDNQHHRNVAYLDCDLSTITTNWGHTWGHRATNILVDRCTFNTAKPSGHKRWSSLVPNDFVIQDCTFIDPDNGTITTLDPPGGGILYRSRP